MSDTCKCGHGATAHLDGLGCMTVIGWYGASCDPSDPAYELCPCQEFTPEETHAEQGS